MANDATAGDIGDSVGGRSAEFEDRRELVVFVSLLGVAAIACSVVA